MKTQLAKKAKENQNHIAGHWWKYQHTYMWRKLNKNAEVNFKNCSDHNGYCGTICHQKNCPGTKHSKQTYIKIQIKKCTNAKN